MFYKYYSATNEYSIPNIEKGIICFSDIDKFNDPFEGIGKYLHEVSFEEQEYWDTMGLDFPKALGKRFSQESRDLLKFKQRIWCATESYDNDLMWAHYADSHRGFCVGYTEENIRKVCHGFEKITYCAEPTPINIHGNIDMNFVERLLFQKGLSWKYEQEWRAIYTMQPKDVLHLDFSHYFENCFEDDPEFIYVPHGCTAGGNVEVLRSPRIILQKCPPSEVYLGLRTDQKIRNRIIEICKKQGIPVFQMCLIPDLFKLNAVRVTDTTGYI